MSGFNWEIEETGGALTSAGKCDEVILEDLSICPAKKVWVIEESDNGMSLEPISGGTIDKIAVSETAETGLIQNIGSLNLGKKFMQIIIVIGACILALGFLAVVVAGVWRGELDFQTYIVGMASFFAGLGFRNRKKS